MSKGLKLIILIVGGIIIIAGVIMVLLSGGSSSDVVVGENGQVMSDGNGNGGSLPTNNRLIINDNVEVVATKENSTTLTSGQTEEIDLERLASYFAERFGTYSNQNNFSH